MIGIHDHHRKGETTPSHLHQQAPRMIRLASAVANIPPGATKHVRLKLTKRGKDVVSNKSTDRPSAPACVRQKKSSGRTN